MWSVRVILHNDYKIICLHNDYYYLFNDLLFFIELLLEKFFFSSGA